MPSYCFYVLDASGATSDYLVKTFPNDQAARESAARMLPGTCGVEIWRGRQLIARLTAGGHAAAGSAVAGWFDAPAPPVAAPVG